MEFKSHFANIDGRKFNTWCRYTTRIDTYGCGCQHDCSYCYAKSLLAFRGLWNPQNPLISNVAAIRNSIKSLQRFSVVKLGGMTDCFQPLELSKRITYKTILWLNEYKINYLIVTKSDLVATDEYIDIYDKQLAHFQISITSTNDKICNKYENATSTTNRIKAIEKLSKMGFDVSVRLSPFIPEFIDNNIINSIKCDKILIEFLKVNHWIRKWFVIDYEPYSLKYGGYNHLTLDCKIKKVDDINKFAQKSVGEYVFEHHMYFRENVNYNKFDCCNLDLKTNLVNEFKQLTLFK